MAFALTLYCMMYDSIMNLREASHCQVCVSPPRKLGALKRAWGLWCWRNKTGHGRHTGVYANGAWPLHIFNHCHVRSATAMVYCTWRTWKPGTWSSCNGHKISEWLKNVCLDAAVELQLRAGMRFIEWCASRRCWSNEGH